MVTIVELPLVMPPAVAGLALLVAFGRFGLLELKPWYYFALALIAIVLFVICFIFALVYQRYALRRDTAGAVTRIEA